VFHTARGSIHILGHWEIDDRVVLITKHQLGDRPPVSGLLVVDRDSGELL
jgi:hypothetical protein